ncbi:hypothetical protein ABZ897_00915 [Nonomuraea sp. NPDC046802]|uniref:hypothetical protein n=1 Tax=Nonomuraea sp. NPDC046802 TaxID=3154919 RepID=UPI0033F9F40E
MSWDPASGITFGQYMRLKGVQVRPAGWTWQTRDQVLEDSPTRRTVRDQVGNDVTERTDDKGGYHRDVAINLRS